MHDGRLRLSGPFASPPPDWTSQIQAFHRRLEHDLPPRPLVSTLLLLFLFVLFLLLRLRRNEL